MIRTILFIVCIFILLGVEIGRVYFIMPFPGSQRSNTIEIAYFLHNYINYFRVLFILITAFAAWRLIRNSNQGLKWMVIVLLLFWMTVLYTFNFRMQADKVFYQPRTKSIVSLEHNKVPTYQLVLGVVQNGESKAYPIEIIGYHHQVRDTVGGEPIMVTYCTVCRTGRVFSPLINGLNADFRLVGMDNFNAMFEDKETGSWWRQVSGESIIGPLKGQQLNEVPSEQMTLYAWISRYPKTKVLQPDSAFIEAYIKLANYDEGKMESRLVGKDSVSWKEKSWVVGVQVGSAARAYDWIELIQTRLINDKLDLTPLVVAVEPDSATFHVWMRPDSLLFSFDEKSTQLIDNKTKSIWDWNGKCVSGAFAGASLSRVQSYQEYWHSWKTFRPQTTQYKRQ